VELPNLGELAVTDMDYKELVLVEDFAVTLGVLVEQRDAVVFSSDDVVHVERKDIGPARKEFGAVRQDLFAPALHTGESAFPRDMPNGVFREHRNRRVGVTGTERLMGPAKQADVVL